MIRTLLGKLDIAGALVLGLLMMGGIVTYVLASAITNFTQTINPGTLAVDIVDGSYVTVGSPSVAMGAVNVSHSCQTSTGTFGSATQQIYVTNPDAADSGWSVTLAAGATTDVWDSAGTDFDFNDPNGAGCTDGAGDADTVGGQMTVDPAVGTLAIGQCNGCTTANVTKGSSASYNQGTTDSITILTGAALSDDIGDWTLQGVNMSQKIPAGQPAATDYDINLTLTVAAS